MEFFARIPQPIKLTLHLSGSDASDYSVTKKEIDGIVVSKFSDKLTSKLPKLYITLEGNEVVYVGFTSDSITSRLTSGLKPSKKLRADGTKNMHHNGYAGYKWRMLSMVNFYVWVFETVVNKETKWMFENIEAELVFLLKQKQSWPKYQSEIHFYSEIEGQMPKKAIDEFGKNEREVAEEMLKSLK